MQARMHRIEHLSAIVLGRDPQIPARDPALAYRSTNELFIRVDWNHQGGRVKKVETKAAETHMRHSRYERIRIRALARRSRSRPETNGVCWRRSGRKERVITLPLNFEPVPNARMGIYSTIARSVTQTVREGAVGLDSPHFRR